MGQNLLILIILISVGIFAIVKFRSQNPQTSRGRWQTSTNGNQTMVVDGTRVTIFPQDDGWTYCVADEGDDGAPYFSDPYETIDAAKYEAIAFINGDSTRYLSIREQRLEQRFEGMIAGCEFGAQQREQLIADISDLLKREDLNITALRKPERKIASGLKSIEWHIPQCHYYPDGDRENAIAKAEKQKMTLRELAQRVESRISELKNKRKRPPQK